MTKERGRERERGEGQKVRYDGPKVWRKITELLYISMESRHRYEETDQRGESGLEAKEQERHFNGVDSHKFKKQQHTTTISSI